MNKLLTTALIILLSMPAHAVTLKIATVTPEGSQWMEDMRAKRAPLSRTGQHRPPLPVK